MRPRERERETGALGSFRFFGFFILLFGRAMCCHATLPAFLVLDVGWRLCVLVLVCVRARALVRARARVCSVSVSREL